MKKKLFALLLTLAMVLSLFPSSVIAAGAETDPLSAMVDGTCVQVAELQGELPEGVSLSVEKLEGEKAALYLQDMAKWGVNVKDNALVLDVKLLDEKGMPYQPEDYGQLVQLSFLNAAFGESTKVWHYMSEPAASAEEAPAPEIKSPLRSRSFGPAFSEVGAGFGGVVSCTTGSFSVYVVGDTPRLTVKLMQGTTELESVVVTSADEVDTVVYVPDLQAISTADNEVMRGWTEKSDYTLTDADSALADTAAVRAAVKTKLSGLTADETITFYAMIYQAYSVTYRTEDATRPVLKTDTVLTQNNAPVTYTISATYSPNNPETQAFQGWEPEETGVVAEPGPFKLDDVVTISGNVTFLPQVPYGNWLIFIENGGTYTIPQFVEEGTLADKPTDPTKRNHSFGGWYREEDFSGEAFDFTKDKITSTTRLYAKWVPNDQVPYSILIWKQNLEGTGYDFVEAVNGTGDVGSNIKDKISISGDTATINKAYTWKGFTPQEPDNVTIEVNGSSTLNLLFDRKTVTLNFYLWQRPAAGYTYTVVNGRWGSEGNYYTSNDSSAAGGQNTTYVYYNNDDGKWYTSREWSWDTWSFTFSGTAYDTVYNRRQSSGNFQWTLVKSISGLYGTPVGDQWPNEINGTAYWWYATGNNNGTTSGTRTTVLADFLPAEGSSVDINFYGDDPSGNNATIHFMQETADGGYVETNTVTTSTGYNGGSFYLSDKYNGFKCYAWNTSNNTNSWTLLDENTVKVDGSDYYDADPSTSAFDRAEFTTNLYIYFKRLTYEINFMDGVYFDPKTNPMQVTLTKTGVNLSHSGMIAYGASLADFAEGGASYYKPDPTESNYYFAGWYMDENCENLYDFASMTMPVGGVTVYAKWILAQYRVILHGNIPEDAEQVNADTPFFGISSWCFRVDEGEEINVSDGVAKNYEFVGWFRDEGGNQPFSSEAHRAKAAIATDYDMNSMSTEWDENGVVSGKENTNSDLTGYNGGPRFWIEKKIDIYAKWRKILDGAEGINVQYDVDGTVKTDLDTGLYKDTATANAADAPDVSGKYFLYWIVQKWNGSSFEDTSVQVLPGQTFTVLADDSKVEAIDADNNKYIFQLKGVYEEEGEAVTVKVTFDPNGGEFKDAPSGFAATKEYPVNSDILVPNAEREDYEFQGWGYGDTPTILIAPDKISDTWGANNLPADAYDAERKSNVLVAVWKQVVFKVTYEYDSSAPADAPALPEVAKYHYGVDVNVAADPTMEGYTFNGWTCTTPDVSSGSFVMPEADVTITGSWTINKYKIKFVDEDGKTVLLAEKEYDYGTAAADIEKPDDPTKAATPQYTYIFAGWDPEVAEVKADATYTATYTETENKYKVKFVDEDGTTVLLAEKEYAYGTAAADVEKPDDPQKPATDTTVYIFAGWDPDIEDVTDNATYTATYEEYPIEDFQVRVLYVSSGNGSVSPESEVFTAQMQEDGSYESALTFTASGATATPDEGYVLKNWTNENGDTNADGKFQFDKVPVGTTVTVTANFAEDKIGGGDNGDEPDGIPDEYQVIVYYKADANGKITGKTFEAFTAEADDNGRYPTAIAVKSSGTTAEANEDYTLKNWTNDQNSETSADGVFDFGEVKLGSKINVTANFAEDKIGGGDNGDEPDGIPDEYQVIVYYKADANGKITGKTFETFTAEADDKGEYPAAIAVKSSGTTAEANEDYTLKNWTNDQNSETSADGVFDFGEVKLGSKINVTANFAEDKIGGGDNGDEPDGIPDEYQVIVYYETDGNGTVTGKTFETFTAEEENGQYPAAIAVKSTGSEAEPNEGYVLKNWTNDQNDETSADGVFDFGEVKLGSKINVTANFAEDKIGGGDNGDEPDGIPDEYQVIVYYKADGNGTVTGKTFETFTAEADDKGEYPAAIAVKSTGSEAEPNEGYALDNWTNDQNDETSADGVFDFGEVELGTEITINANFDTDEIGEDEDGDGEPDPDGIPDKYQILITYETDGNGKITGKIFEVITAEQDAEGKYAEKIKAASTGSEAEPNEGYALDNWTNDQNDETSADGAFDFGEVALGTEITVTANFDIDAIGGGDEGDEPDGTPDKYQILIKYVADAHGTITGAKAQVINPQPDGSGVYPNTVDVSAKGSEAKPDDGYLLKDWTNDFDEQTSTDGAFEFKAVPLGTTITVTAAFLSESGDPRTITYKDGVNGTVFQDVVYTAYDGDPTPRFGQEGPGRVNFLFIGWNDGKKTYAPDEELPLVNGDATYTAQWRAALDPIYPPAPVEPSPVLNYDDHVAYIKGFEDGTFRPNDNLTRAQSATMIYRLLTEERQKQIYTTWNNFSDVDASKWYNEYVSSMANGDYVKGYPDGTFGGDKLITRAEFVTMLVRFFGVLDADCRFTDVARDHWAYQYIATATAYGWLTGYEDNTFRPNQPITRAEAVTVINRMLNRGVDATSNLGLFNVKTFTDVRDASKWYFYEVIEAANDHEYTGHRPNEQWSKVW